MAVLVIDGPCRLHGAINVHGAKNSTLPLLAACLLCRGQVVLHNCPRLSDVETASQILRQLGCVIQRQGEPLVVDPRGVCGSSIPESLMRENAVVHCVFGGAAGPHGAGAAFVPRRV